MNLRRLIAIIREALASAGSQPVASVVSIIMVAGMCATVLLTIGRTVGAEQAVLSSIDSAGTRSIVVRADGDAGLTTAVLTRLANLDGIQWAGAFGAAHDMQNAAFPGGTRVPVRLAWGDNLTEPGGTDTLPMADKSALASTIALEQLGMPDGVGGVIADSGDDYPITGRIDVPDYLHFLEPLVIVPQTPTPDAAAAPVSVLVVIAARPDLVTPVSQAMQSVLAVDDPTKMKLSTSESLAQLRALIQGQLGSFGRGLVIVIFALTAVLVAAILYGLVMLRRKRLRPPPSTRRLPKPHRHPSPHPNGHPQRNRRCPRLRWRRDRPDRHRRPPPGHRVLRRRRHPRHHHRARAALLPALAAARRDPLKELRVP